MNLYFAPLDTRDPWIVAQSMNPWFALRLTYIIIYIYGGFCTATISVGLAQARPNYIFIIINNCIYDSNKK